MASSATRDGDQARAVLGPVAVVHVAVLAFLVGARALAGAPVGTATEWFHSALVEWDAVHYLDLAAYGYGQDHLAVFLPAYPLLARLGGWLVGDLVVGALLVSGVAHLAAGWLLFRLARLDASPAVARRAVLALLAFPTAFSAVLPYTESLFLAFVFGAVLAFRGRRLWTAALLALLATLTRIPGVALVGLFAAEWAAEQRREVPWQRALPALLAPGVALAVYLGINAVAYGEPLHFLAVQRDNFHRSLAWPTAGFWQAWGALQRPLPEALTVGASDLLGSALAWLAAVWSVRRLRPSYAAFALVSAALITFQSWWISNLRYAFAIFPVHLMLARATAGRAARWAILAAGFTLQALLALQFARGQWAM